MLGVSGVGDCLHFNAQLPARIPTDMVQSPWKTVFWGSYSCWVVLCSDIIWVHKFCQVTAGFHRRTFWGLRASRVQATTLHGYLNRYGVPRLYSSTFQKINFEVPVCQKNPMQGLLVTWRLCSVGTHVRTKAVFCRPLTCKVTVIRLVFQRYLLLQRRCCAPFGSLLMRTPASLFTCYLLTSLNARACCTLMRHTCSTTF